jgi:hypothetical protein
MFCYYCQFKKKLTKINNCRNVKKWSQPGHPDGNKNGAINHVSLRENAGSCLLALQVLWPLRLRINPNTFLSGWNMITDVHLSRPPLFNFFLSFLSLFYPILFHPIPVLYHCSHISFSFCFSFSFWFCFSQLSLSLSLSLSLPETV